MKKTISFKQIQIAINALFLHADVVKNGHTNTKSPLFFLTCLVISISSANSFADSPNYQFNIIPALQGSSLGNSIVTGLGNNGQVIGNSDIGSTQTAFVYSNNVSTSLGTLGGFGSQAVAISSSGMIVGYSLVSRNLFEHSFSYSNGYMQDLGIYAQTMNLSPNGLIAGTVYDANGRSQAMTYSNGVVTTLQSQYGSYASAINDSGQVVGSFYSAPGSQAHPFVSSNGVIQDIGQGQQGNAFAITNDGKIAINFNNNAALMDQGGIHLIANTFQIPPSPSFPEPFTFTGKSRGMSMSSNGLIAGYADFQVGTDQTNSPIIESHAFLFKDGSLIDVGTLGGSGSEAYGVNALGEVIGVSPTTSGKEHPFFYSNGSLYDLYSLLPTDEQSWVIQTQDGLFINDSGQIAGTIYDGSHTYGFLISTVPVPAAAWLFSSGIISLIATYRRRR